MKKYTEKQSTMPMPTWETLEAFVREHIQALIQQVLEEEVTAFLGREKHVRRQAVDGHRGYRNGFGKPRRVTLQGGTIEVRRPRLRGLEERFESRILPLFRRRTAAVGEAMRELYLHGLAQGDFTLALRGLLGEGAPLSAASVARLQGKWQAEYDQWCMRRLDDRELVYAWLDGVYVKAGLEKEKAALLVVIGAMSDGRKEVLAVTPGYRESVESWAGVLRDLRDRGLAVPKLVVADGNLGAWGAIAQLWPETAEQRCWNHKILNVLDKLPKRVQSQARSFLTEIPYAPSRAEAEKKRDVFIRRYGRDYPEAARCLCDDWERMVTFYQFPKEHWRHIRTTNVVESPFAAVRLRTGAAKRFKKRANATALIWKVLMVAEKRFRKLNAPELMAQVYAGYSFEDGKPIANHQHVKVAA